MKRPSDPLPTLAPIPRLERIPKQTLFGWWTNLTSCFETIKFDEGNDLPSGVEGELQARDSSVFTSYLNDQQASKAAFTKDDWFKTGDLATIDTDGYLRITGRTKEIINRGGIKYNPAEVEAILANHPAIAMCAIVPVPDPTLGERACLCVQATPGHTITLEEACKLLDDNKMAKYKWPERLELFDELPMTPTRKVQRAKVAALLSK